MTSDADVRLLEAADLAAKTAASFAAEVDGDARFPTEAVDVMRDNGMLSALVPAELGGGGASFAAVAEACRRLGRACGASAMVFAMHQIQVAVICRHLGDSAWYRDYLQRLNREQRLIASATSEVGIGGDLGRSAAAVVTDSHGCCSYEKQAPTISYGAHADDLFTTLRRTPDAEPGDQVIVLTTGGQHRLEPTGSWDPLGMRGTCSPGFVARATFAPEQVLPTPFRQASAESMVPVSHLLWAHLWLGIANEAAERARAYVRAAASRSGGSPGTAGQRLAQLVIDQGRLRADITAALQEFERMSAEPGRPGLSTMATALRFNGLKVGASELTADICLAALRVTGIMGFKNDSPFSVGRQVRDALSGAVMIANDRLLDSNASLLLVVKDL